MVLISSSATAWERLRAAIAQAKPRLPRDHGHLAALDSSYNYLRQFTPTVLSTVGFARRTASRTFRPRRSCYTVPR